jgi:excisionase family DNA binding protein
MKQLSRSHQQPEPGNYKLEGQGTGPEARVSFVRDGKTVATVPGTAEEAAKYLKVKTHSLLLWVRQRKVPAYALSGTRRGVWRFRQQDLDAALLSKPLLNSLSPAVLTERKAM